MSARQPTETIVARLADGLTPVRPVPPLYRQAIALAAVWAGSAAVAVGWLGLHPLDTVARGAVSTALLALLSLIGVAGLATGLACRLPGRERLAVVTAIGAALGVVAAVAIGFALPGSAVDAIAFEGSADCVARSILLAVPSGLLATGLAGRGAPWRPRAAGLGLALGAASLGALLVHASCPSPSAPHWLTAHALLPLATGTATGLLVAGHLDRLARRSRRALARALDA